jgi:hypothetical protein
MTTPTDAARSGLQTTELWGKLLVQVILLANALFGLGIDIPDELALQLVAGMEGAYTIGRAITKSRTGQATTLVSGGLPPTIVNVAAPSPDLVPAGGTSSPPPLHPTTT